MGTLTPNISLHAKLDRRVEAEPKVLRLTRDPYVSSSKAHGLLLGKGLLEAHLSVQQNAPEQRLRFALPIELQHLTEGDIVRLNPRRGELWVMYRCNSRHNSVLLTERCNSWCVMCSQPPKSVDDSHLASDWSRAIPLMSPHTVELGFTGGEPVLLGESFFSLLELCRDHLPKTSIHVLSNGRLFSYLNYARRIAGIELADVMIGIPLYSDIDWRHEFVVQARGAFDQTVRGILNLGRCGVPVEIRVVIHRHTLDRLPELATFITRNLPFVHHVALMGLEPIGFGRTNLKSLWVEPAETHHKLLAATETLDRRGIKTSIYNYQLCILPEPLWPFAAQSISDWKNIYLPACEPCELKGRCAGFFHSAASAHSRFIKPFTDATECNTEET